MTARADFLTPKRLARAIGVSEASVKRWCDQGLIETSRTTGGHRRLARASIDAFLERTGRRPLEPESVRLPSLSGSGGRALARGREAFLSALACGSERVALQVAIDLHAAGHSFGAIADDVILAAEQQLLCSADTDVLPRQTATEVCLRIVDVLQASVAESPETAPRAFAGSLDGARSTLPVALSVLVLRETGWKAGSLGVGLPFATLCAAMRRHGPRLLVLHVDDVRNPRRFVEEMSELQREAERAGTHLLTTGCGLSEDAELRAQLKFDGWRPSFRALQIESGHRVVAEPPSSRDDS